MNDEYKVMEQMVDTFKNWAQHYMVPCHRYVKMHVYDLIVSSFVSCEAPL